MANRKVALLLRIKAPGQQRPYLKPALAANGSQRDAQGNRNSLHAVADWDRFKRGREEKLRYFEGLLEVYEAFPANRIVGEYSRVTDHNKFERNNC
jgi:hypothetical protein